MPRERCRQAVVTLALVALGACVAAEPPPVESPVVARGKSIAYSFPAAGDDVVVSSDTMGGRATALLFITTFDLASQLVARRLGDLITSFTPRANAAAVVVEAPLYADLLPAYRDSLSLPFPVVMADFATQRGAGPFGDITRVPTLVVLDREGREVSRLQGSLDSSEIEGALRRASASR